VAVSDPVPCPHATRLQEPFIENKYETVKITAGGLSADPPYSDVVLKRRAV